MDDYHHSSAHPASMAGTFYTEFSAANEILNSEKQHLMTVYKKRAKNDPEMNIKDDEIKAMFQI